MMGGKTHKLLKSAGATAEHHKVFRDVHVPDLFNHELFGNTVIG